MSTDARRLQRPGEPRLLRALRYVGPAPSLPQHMRVTIRTTAAIAAIAAIIMALGIAAFVGSRSPIAAFQQSSFEAFGWHLTLAGAYADPSGTVLDFSGVPPKTLFGTVNLYDAVGIMHPAELGRNDDRGDEALGFRPAAWPAGAFAMHYTLAFGDHQVAAFTVPPGGGSTLAAPTGGSLAAGSVVFSTVRYGGRALFFEVHASGIEIFGGFGCGEVACPPRPGLEMELIPLDGGAPIRVSQRNPARGDDTVVHAVAMLVDPGAYTLRLSFGNSTLDRPVVVG